MTKFLLKKRSTEMKAKKLTLAMLGLVSAFTLAACSNSQDIITMKGGTITVDEFYEEVKTDQSAQQRLTTMVISKVANDNYGDKVDKKQVDKQFKETKEQFGDSFSQQLAMAGMTEDSYKDSIKDGLAFQEMLKAHIKITDKDLKEIWATYHPDVDVQLISVNEEDKAKDLAEKAKSEDFAKLAKENSTHASATDEGKVTIKSTDTTLPEEVKEAAYKLKDGEVSDLITVSGFNGYEETKEFYIVKMVKNKEKGNDMTPYKKELKKIATDQKMSDQAFQTKVLGDEFKKANVKVKDKDLTSLLAAFLPQEEKTNKTKENKKTEKKDTKKEDDKKEEKTDETK